MTPVTQEQTPDQEPPVTGVAAIDEALAQIDLTGPVADHHEQLGRALEALQRALNAPAPDPEPR